MSDDVILELSPNPNINSLPGTGGVSQAEVKRFLTNWLLEYNVDRTPTNALLRFLKRIFPRLPVDTRTLMKTPRNREVIDVSPGKYVHLGLKKSVDVLLGSLNVEDLPNEIKLTFNIDGLPIAKSSTVSFWLILGRIENIPKLRKCIFLVGAYHGYKKPSCFNNFLEEFVKELKDMIHQYTHRNRQLKVEVYFIICDAPALANVKYVKSHNGYYGCTKCVQKGERIDNRTVCKLNNCTLRTNVNFRDRNHPEHHNGHSCLEFVEELDMVKHFPLDPLHLIYLGVMKRFLRIWIYDEDGNQIGAASVEAVSSKLKNIGSAQPSEFQRKCRSLSEIGYFKGHEFRTFLLYSGPVVMKHILPPEKYDHFLLLHVAITILNSSEWCRKLYLLAECLLKEFVNLVPELYDPHHVVYCVHNLVHLAADVKVYGNLNEYAAFPFESYMFRVKRLVKKHNMQLAELCNRMEERNIQEFIDKTTEPTFPLFKKKAIIQGNRVFREVQLNGFRLNNKNGNNWFLTKNLKTVRFEYAEEMNGLWWIYGHERMNKTDFYSIPVQSTKLCIYQSFRHEDSGKLFPLTDVWKKMFRMKYETNFDVFFPLSHCN